MLLIPTKKSEYKLIKKNEIAETGLKSIAENIVCFGCKKIKQSKNECFYSCNDCNEIFCERCITHCFPDGLFNAGLLID